ncbi:ATPase family associated with various cellular activities (AAA) [Chishuiella changwenlii]|uniref:ATPase AAA n=1 Tax=Chishuiella changwenlii TaxID=1434701 RepID=A0A1M7B3R2_9FLAO|nr:DNA repair ATPase [Chishuiella changwenlii]GGE95791.1 ATPase AAA [Chishuiella changwenlii]SHL49658.1 ATPase family associated with various cellular activities (AAA) [Chishuiella changwenlii]
MQEENVHITETLDAGAYEIIRKRLLTQKDILSERLLKLNEARKEVFNSSNFILNANQRITTENTCVARGIIAFDQLCIFGYNVHFGLRTDIQLSDVFSIYLFQENQFIPQNLQLIDDQNFFTDFQNLYKYYRDSIFSKFRRTDNYLYMVFQTSKNAQDLKAFKWLIKDGQLIYQDDRSIHEVQKADQFDFEWTKTGLEDRRLGKFPHISILDKVFIEAIGGDITFKIEDNTDSGKGIYTEKVTNIDQQLDDAEYYYADLGNLITVRIKPFQEDFRSYIFNVRTKEVVNVPALLDAAVLLPDNQGLIFSNGYYLQNGTYHLFDNNLENFQFFRRINSPNGEDFMYIFNQDETNTYILLSYNIIQQTVETPIICNGFTIFKDGHLIYFRTEEEATRHHQVQIWETPYVEQLIENKEKTNHPLYKIGNKDIVKAMAESQEIIQLINKEDSYEGLYEDIVKKSNSLLDSYFWINSEDTFQLDIPLLDVKSIANTAIDEFAKVQVQKKFALESLEKTEEVINDIVFKINSSTYNQLDLLVEHLAEARKLQGRIIDLKSVRYIQLERVQALEEQLNQITVDLSEKTIAFLLLDEALIPYEEKVAEQKVLVENIQKAIDAKEIEEACLKIASELELLIDILNSLKIEDATQTTKIIEKISFIFALLNEVRAQLTRKISSLRSKESVAEFSAQMTLLEQSIVNFLELSTTEEKTEEYNTKLIVQLEELDSKFSDFEEFSIKIADKRDEIIKAFNTKREQIIEQKNKRTNSLEQIGLRVLKNIENKAASFSSKEDILAFYSSDLMIDKIRQLIQELKDLEDVSKAENLENLLKKSQEDTLRVLRDKTELFVDGENIIALGTNKFAVNNQRLALTLLNRNNELFFHLTGTSFYQKVKNEEIYNYQAIWNQEFISENQLVYRAEFLVYQAILASDTKDFDAELFINQTIEQNYTEGYIKGVHNFDALRIYQEINKTAAKLDLLKFDKQTRITAQFFWNSLDEKTRDKLKALLNSAQFILKSFPNSKRFDNIIKELIEQYDKWITTWDKSITTSNKVAGYIFQTFTKYQTFSINEEANLFKNNFISQLKDNRTIADFESLINDDNFSSIEKFYLVENWINSWLDENEDSKNSRNYVDEVAMIILFSEEKYHYNSGNTLLKIEDLKGNHTVISEGIYEHHYHDIMNKLEHFSTIDVPNFNAFKNLKDDISKNYEKELKIKEFEPKVLTSFVRNKLINEVYFPLIGNNLAKQLGAAGDNKRTARMGMLLLISPPGYGKTTLMEYLAKTMGLHFVKVNGPTIGHSITSIDPVEAKTSGEREELKKINLSFEMADNVMLYLDDIQHLSSEFLQKFISLADGQRKIDGIFDGESKTYDLRGKRFCIVMAGNPYTESGSKFQIPDMLANRADVYNLGDVIGDTETLFNLSLIENATSDNPYLDKIASKSLDDFYKLTNFVTENLEQLPNLEGNYLSQEIDDFVTVLKHVIKIRNIVVKVNQNYILSAAMQDDYRTEPPFKMQGSYRNMSKLVGRIVPMMNDKEIDDTILAHYESESQTLTADTESNLLKLKEIAGLITPQEKERWETIKATFFKNNKHGGLSKDDKVFSQLVEFNENLEGIINAILKK